PFSEKALKASFLLAIAYFAYIANFALNRALHSFLQSLTRVSTRARPLKTNARERPGGSHI
ncbi:MAG TPA: hypothetical protein VLT35_02855, partial [Methanocella sp.]|nr:hypothetical protein [Methanocella sp.]